MSWFMFNIFVANYNKLIDKLLSVILISIYIQYCIRIFQSIPLKLLLHSASGFPNAIKI